MTRLISIFEVLRAQRKDRAANPDMEIAWQDFVELSKEEQIELLFIGLYQTTQTTKWLQEFVRKPD